MPSKYQTKTMYNCKLPPEQSLGLLFNDFDDISSKDIVVVALYPVKVMTSIYMVYGPFSPLSERLEFIYQMLDASFFVLPIIAFNGAAIRVCDGRHRTSAMCLRSEAVIPFLTAKEMAPVIYRDLGTTHSTSMFDFSEIGYPLYKG